ncbi:30S ribosomal protein S12 methylthiotransferase RimO [Prochlorococcus marinus]|uniref:Ribosomal protein uS12 methylthiotransferase RimO n=1 Tax=Prochlorococcus marinus (strain MIT 9211) TaxID=93059 RepID=RIMO_PROM4|nr:30S ribosomal protein S12 methylthiotransferase RimO [Prochlorococcus marinus]A9BCV9.1 RecName: Full=Ribosomal protein uS12 methylthiotransferase RimO; Short=uS12 MTTase; Short=uS12 methylthiotransferase; AltName: Full=Ribosomal protein uS12 (aspartate-C(3))-methylthiotransferase; AltName: Full=Ribosome maturation factor RimO [Prochlorococcus marinus str. MIT 9211]ABX08047.1 possible Fe-S oxidoreductase [Prochlorococcus marinus str. MIT 9211]
MHTSVFKEPKNNDAVLSNHCNASVAFLHLGCEKNLVDTEHMMGLLASEGYGVSSNTDDAEVVVVNTCSFIEQAREESVRALVGLADQGKEIIIAGCLAQHFKSELLESIPEAKAIVGTGDYQNIIEVLQRVRQGERVNQVSENPKFVGDENLPRYRTTGRFVSYLKVAEGCNYRCAFCIIPTLRGNQRSRSVQSIVNEANQLAKEGIQELILISQITTNYGMDLYGRPYLADLLRALSHVDIPWIRIHYAYPTGLTPEVVLAYKEVPNVLPYFDLPLQHSHPDVLRAMNRPWQSDVSSALLNRIKEQLPEAVMRTTLIVGFPGETKAQFDHLCAFVENQKFDHVGVFAFSREEGTEAAKLPNQVPFEIAQARKDKLVAIQQPISAAKNQALIGQTVDVLIEREDLATGELIGRSARFAPEVDGEVRLRPSQVLFNDLHGKIVPALITGSELYDLTGEINHLN